MDLSKARTIKTQGGTVYEPYADGHAIGFKCTHPDGRVGYVMLNPSNEDRGDTPSIFTYVGPSDDLINHEPYGGWIFPWEGQDGPLTFPRAEDRSGYLVERNGVTLGRIEKVRGKWEADIEGTVGVVTFEKLGTAKEFVRQKLDGPGQAAA